jgi:hypothetical protein
VTLFGIFTVVRLWQYQKAQFSILVTLLGIVMCVSLVPLRKSMVVIWFGISAEVIRVPENAPAPMFVTLLGIKMLDILVPENAPAPMVITVGGIVMEANGHWTNARSPITNKLLGKIMDVRLEQ